MAIPAILYRNVPQAKALPETLGGTLAKEWGGDCPPEPTEPGKPPRQPLPQALPLTVCLGEKQHGRGPAQAAIQGLGWSDGGRVSETPQVQVTCGHLSRGLGHISVATGGGKRQEQNVKCSPLRVSCPLPAICSPCPCPTAAPAPPLYPELLRAFLPVPDPCVLPPVWCL